MHRCDKKKQGRPNISGLGIRTKDADEREIEQRKKEKKKSVLAKKICNEKAVVGDFQLDSNGQRGRLRAGKNRGGLKNYDLSGKKK